ncbi:hypothetical protein [Blastococcus sp. SYSU DS0533]
MTFRQLVSAVRRSVPLVLACVLAGAALAAAYGAIRADRYISESELFLSVTETAEGTSRQDTLYLQQRMQSYAAVVASPALGRRVADSLGLDFTGEQVAAMITVSVPADTVLLEVQVQDSSAVRAQQIADAVGEEFAQLLPSLERSPAGPVQAVDVTTIQPASVPTSPAGPGIALLVTAGALAGLVAGIGLSLLRAALDETVQDGQEVAALGVLHLGTVPAPRGRSSRRRGEEGFDRWDALRSVRLHLLTSADTGTGAGMTVTIAGVDATVDVSSLCGDLGGVLAAGGARVVVVDTAAGGPERPTEDDRTDAGRRADLVAVLRGEVRPEAALAGVHGTVPVLRGHGGPPDSALLHGPGLAALLAGLAERYDFVLVAAPPLTRRPDAEALAAASDGVVLVVAPGRTRRRPLLRTLRTFEALHIRLVGILLAERTTR